MFGLIDIMELFVEREVENLIRHLMVKMEYSSRGNISRGIGERLNSTQANTGPDDTFLPKKSDKDQ